MQELPALQQVVSEGGNSGAGAAAGPGSNAVDGSGFCLW